MDIALDFLANLTRDVIDAARIAPEQAPVKGFGPNRSGGVIIKPGGGDCYPSFWIRDYAMSLDSGFIQH